jgi:hypothetical protein
VIILAIDPGPKESAYVAYASDNKLINRHGYLPNDELMKQAFDESSCTIYWDLVVIEWIEGYGLTVGRETFDTCRWVGRFEQAAGGCHLLGRKSIKSHLCSTTTAKDKDIRAALIDKFGEPGSKKNPGPTYGITGDEWSALSVAVTWAETHREEA